jgi:iron complex outermembrane receptor protein
MQPNDLGVFEQQIMNGNQNILQAGLRFDNRKIISTKPQGISGQEGASAVDV